MQLRLTGVQMPDKAHTDGYCAPLQPYKTITTRTFFKSHKQPSSNQLHSLKDAHLCAGLQDGLSSDYLKQALRIRNGVKLNAFTRVTALPAEIDDYVPDYVKTEESRAARLAYIKKHHTARPFLKLNNGNLVYRTELPDGEIYLFAEVDGKLAYLCELVESEVKPDGFSLPDWLPKLTAYQASVWQDPELSRTLSLNGKSIAQAAFWKLLDTKGCILSDETQSMLGRKFWERMVSQALASGYKVYAFTVLEGSPGEFHVSESVGVENVNEMGSYYSGASDPSGHCIRFFIKK
jgi:hypothetical protein